MCAGCSQPQQTGALAEGFCCSILPSSQGGAKELRGEWWVPGKRPGGTCSLVMPVELAGIEMSLVSALQLGLLVCSKHRVIKSC